jgi:excisionase family DNA binding protein
MSSNRQLPPVSVPEIPARLRAFSLGQVAAALQVNPRTVRRWIAAGWLRAFSLPGNDLRVSQTELEAFVSQRCPAVVAQEVSA